MPRIRSVHPSQWTDESFVECSFAARLFVIAVRNETDDNGIFEWKPKTLKMKLFPADNIDLEPLLAELIDTKQVMKFEVNGIYYGMVRNFQKYQRPEKPKFLYPTPAALPTGYSLNVKYSANNNNSKAMESPAPQQPVGDQSAKLNSEGTGTGDGIEHSSELLRNNSSECDAHTQSFQNLDFSEEFWLIAKDAGLTEEVTQKSWKKFKIHYDSSPPAKPTTAWKKWVLNEFKPSNSGEPPPAPKLSVEEAMIEALGRLNWKRKMAKNNGSLMPKPDELRTLMTWEAKNGAVTWDNLKDYQQQRGEYATV